MILPRKLLKIKSRDLSPKEAKAKEDEAINRKKMVEDKNKWYHIALKNHLFVLIVENIPQLGIEISLIAQGMISFESTENVVYTIFLLGSTIGGICKQCLVLNRQETWSIVTSDPRVDLDSMSEFSIVIGNTVSGAV